MKQGSPEWFAARLGCVTASRVADVIAMTKNGPSERRNTYLYQLVAERLTGLPTETFVSDDMQRGIDMEAEARTLYELRADAFVFEMPFVPHPKIPKCGASPDGKVNADLLIEIKCPRQQRHVETMLTRKVPSVYKPQMDLQMACTGAQAVDYVSYCQAMPPELQIVVIRHERNEEVLNDMEQKVEAFLREVNDAVVRALESAREAA